jgi:hypothetical protein
MQFLPGSSEFGRQQKVFSWFLCVDGVNAFRSKPKK